ncbi:MAG: S-layer homology domain-containing protein [Armatimonadota bacterium]|jgi:hypothetical protein
MRIPTFCALLCVCLVSCVSSDSFKDVPEDHWAAESVEILKANGVLQGYPDGTFRGDAAVTRYELAVALTSMIDYMEHSLKPEVESQKSQASTQPAKPSDKEKSKDAPAQALKDGGFIAADSVLLKDPDKTISASELSEALASVAKKLIENHIPPPTND